MNVFLKKPAGLFVIAVLLLSSAGLFYFNRTRQVGPDFILVQRTDLRQEVSVTGRVEAAEKVALSFNLPGKVAAVNFPVGSSVNKGQNLIRLDTRDAQKALSDAEIALEKAELDLERLRRAATDGLVTKQKAEAELVQLYNQAFNLLSALYAEMPTRFNDLESAFKTQNNAIEGNLDYYRAVAKLYYPISSASKKYEDEYFSVKRIISRQFDDYQKLNRNSPSELIKIALERSYDMLQTAAGLIREARDIARLYRQALTDFGITPTQILIAATDDQLSKLTILAEKLDDQLVAIFSARQKIRDQEERVTDIDLDLRNQELLVKQRQSDLKAAGDRLNDHFLQAPLAGVISEIVPKVGELVTANQPIVSLISAGSYEIEANLPEADIDKVKVGSLAQVTLDAFGRDVVFQAEVVRIDPAAVILDGVATYKITLLFLSQVETVKAGLTADINIFGQEVRAALAIPARAVGRRDGRQYVRVLQPDNQIAEIPIRTGLRSFDGLVEILEGLAEGDRVIIGI